MQELQKACQEKNAGEILKIVGSYGSLANRLVAVQEEENGETVEAFPLSHLLRCEMDPEPWMVEDDNDEAEGADPSVVRLAEAMWPSKLVEGDDPRYLPLPLACRNPTVASTTVRFLAKTCPTAVTVPYDDGDDILLPIHLYLRRENPSRKTVELFSRIHPQSTLQKDPGMRCLNIALQNPTCSNEVWRFLLEKYLSGGNAESFVLKRQDGTPESAIGLSRMGQLEGLLQHTEEFLCHLDAVHTDALFGLCTALSTHDNKLSKLMIVVPDGYAKEMSNRHKWGLLNLVRNNNPSLSHLSIDAPQLEFQLDLVLEALQANTHLQTLAINAKITGCREERTKDRIAKILPQTRLENLRLGANGETFSLV